MKQEMKERAEVERQQKVLNMSRGRSAGKKLSAADEFGLDVDEDQLGMSSKKPNPFNQDRTQTAPPRNNDVPNLSNMNMARPSTGNGINQQQSQPQMGGREQKKAARAAALAQLQEEEDRDAKVLQAEVDRKAKIYDNMARRKSKSPMKKDKNDPTEVEMEDDDGNANLGATFKSNVDDEF